MSRYRVQTKLSSASGSEAHRFKSFLNYLNVSHLLGPTLSFNYNYIVLIIIERRFQNSHVLKVLEKILSIEHCDERGGGSGDDDDGGPGSCLES